jgi:hypothetical protein
VPFHAVFHKKISVVPTGLFLGRTCMRIDSGHNNPKFLADWYMCTEECAASKCTTVSAYP